MNRTTFLRLLATLPLTSAVQHVQALNNLVNSPDSSDKMPVLFVGHGSPMNAIEENEFVKGWMAIRKEIPLPKAILCISAHWETKGTYITAMPSPRTIHDFRGFPKALHETIYPALGNPALAKATSDLVKKTSIGLDTNWGLDHGCWSILKPMFPEANIPVLQLSLDRTQPPWYHYELAKELSVLRKKGILLIGSGNMVHNLGMIAWDRTAEPSFGFDWAIAANSKFKELILNDDHQKLISYDKLGKEVAMAVPTPDHYLPLIYTLALKDQKDKITFFNDKTVMGSISMTSMMIWDK